MQAKYSSSKNFVARISSTGLQKALFLICACSILLFLDACRNKPDREAGNGFPQAAAGNKATAAPGTVNFVTAAKAVTPGVVHIKTLYDESGDAASYFGGRRRAPSAGSGSGVVISADGFIATNNHVIEGASQIEVVFPDRRLFAAKLVGRDPDTDLALLKVEAKDLQFVSLGNSDDVEVGEPVLAVGYPFSLNTTVTAGIVSAKGRSIGIINRQGSSSFSAGGQANTAIESFIQTDAAINPGNSGGALVNTRGELIGINTAIASMTGSYAGYAFAVPVNLAKKILDDLKAYGKVKRGVLGVSFPSPANEEQFLRQQGINPGSVKGVFITGIQEGSAAAAAGLQEGDIIQSIDSVQLFSSAEFSEMIARHRPGDKVSLTYLRKGSVQKTTVTLKGEDELQAARQESLEAIYEKLGARFSTLPESLQERFDLEGGVVVSEVVAGGFFDRIGIPPGTIIAFINGRAVTSPEELEQALVAAQSGRVQLLGIAPDGSRIGFTFSMGA
ncbi:trypsin-like peptidase domain-containing protein [Flavisolibacter sp. BT320]|nr:trypsin-like peptidase domain-containing protein [Flavisolibacter longurius]